MPPRTRTTYYFIEPYGMELHVHVVPDTHEFKTKHGLAPATGEAVLACVVYDEKLDPDTVGVWVRPDTPEGVIAHEALHVVTAVAKSRRFNVKWGNDEPAAYLLQWAFEAITQAKSKAL